MFIFSSNLLGFFRIGSGKGGSDTVSTEPQKTRWIPPSVEYLTPLAGDELSRWELAPGDIFIVIPSGKVLRLKRAGDVLERAWREHYAQSHQLRILPLVNTDRVQALCELYHAWGEATDPEDAEVAAFKFMNAVRSGMSKAGGLTMLDWAFTCHSLFQPNLQLVEEFQAQHVVLYRRGLLVSSLAVLFSIACGYRDPLFLREMYQAAWYLDSGLIHESFTYWVALACQAERIRPGEGGKFLITQKASEQEHALFFTHPRRSFERAQADAQSTFTFPELLLSVLHHHEKSDGSGFPEKSCLSVLSDWETLMVLADSLVDYREDVLEQNLRQGWKDLWSVYLKSPVQGLPVQSVVDKLVSWAHVASPEKEKAA